MRWLFFGTSGYLARLLGMDYAYEGSPYVMGPANGTRDLNAMDYSYRGSPFVGFIK